MSFVLFLNRRNYMQKCYRSRVIYLWWITFLLGHTVFAVDVFRNFHNFLFVSSDLSIIQIRIRFLRSRKLCNKKNNMIFWDPFSCILIRYIVSIRPCITQFGWKNNEETYFYQVGGGARIHKSKKIDRVFFIRHWIIRHWNST